MQNQSAAHRQISASTIGRYRAMRPNIAAAPGTTTSARTSTRCSLRSRGSRRIASSISAAAPGRDLVTFRDLGDLVVGLDGCPEFVAMARAVSGCEVWQQDMLAMTLPPASFDGVFASAVLFRLPSRALPAALDRLHAALKPEGALLASNPRGQDEQGFVDGRYACFYSFRTWRRVVSRSGFDLVDHYSRPRQAPPPAAVARHGLAQVRIARSAQRSLKMRRCEPGATSAEVRSLMFAPLSDSRAEEFCGFSASKCDG
jgi:Methyltransferase domain